MNEKLERKTMKNWTKRMLSGMFDTLEGSTVMYMPKDDQWHVSFRLGYDVPAGMEACVEGFDQDRLRADVIAFMKKNQEDIIKQMEMDLGASCTHDGKLDYNFAVPMPPMFNVVKRDNEWRFMTEEERKPFCESSEVFRKGIEMDQRMVDEGIYELIPDANTDIDIEAFRLKKYTALRGRYDFVISSETLRNTWMGAIQQLQSA